jgi:deoxyadenosine/deoxycytidine kinase
MAQQQEAVETPMSFTPPPPPQNRMTHNPWYFVLAGLIGAGKTTAAEMLSQRFRIPLMLEDVSGNPYLADFYNDKGKHAYALQIYLLTRRLEQINKLGNGGAVSDRSIYEDSAFLYALHKDGFITTRDRNTYRRLMSLISPNMRRPDVIFWLRTTPEQALQRIQERGRDCEKNINLPYLRRLEEGYVALFEELRKQNHIVMELDWNADLESNHGMLADIVSHTLMRKSPTSNPFVTSGEALLSDGTPL